MSRNSNTLSIVVQSASPSKIALAAAACTTAKSYAFINAASDTINWLGSYGGHIFQTRVGGGELAEDNCKGTWDDVNKRLVYWGESHNTSGQQSTTMVCYYQDSNHTWVARPDIQAIYNSGHGYNGTCSDGDGNVYHFRYNSNIWYKMSGSTSAFSQMPDLPGTLTANNGPLVWFPERNSILFLGQYKGLIEFNLTSQTWSTLLPFAGWPFDPNSYNNGGTYDPLRQCCLFGAQIAGSSGANVIRINANGAISSFNQPSIGGFRTPSVFDANGAVMTWDPVSGKALVIDASDRRVWEFNGTQFIDTGFIFGTDILVSANLGELLWAPCDDHGVIVATGCNQAFSQKKMFVYRHT